MLNSIKKNHPEYAKKIEQAFHNSTELGLSPKQLKHRDIDKSDFDELFKVIDSIQPILNYDHIEGACIYVHSILCKEFAKIGYLSELVFGDVLVNGVPHIECSLDVLKKQVHDGHSTKKQLVHCWLLLESGHVFDATLFRDLTNGQQAAELYGYGSTTIQDNKFEYMPMLMGSDFIKRTNPIDDN